MTFCTRQLDSSNWPTGITYDPEGDGSKMPGSLGVHEHWNNASAKQYSKNLGTGNGIELVKIAGAARSATWVSTSTAVSSLNITSNFGVYPNPTAGSTVINYQLKSATPVSLYLVSMDGKIAKHIKQEQLQAGEYTENFDVAGLKSGIYICVLKTSGGLLTTKLEVR